MDLDWLKAMVEHGIWNSLGKGDKPIEEIERAWSWIDRAAQAMQTAEGMHEEQAAEWLRGRGWTVSKGDT